MFSWTINSPFTILHVDLWKIGHYTDNNGNMEFVVFVLVPVESSTSLASYFIQRVLMTFELCHLVVLDDGPPLKEIYCYKSSVKPKLRYTY